MPIISKSRFVSGMQCEKKLFFDIYRKDLKPVVSEQQEALFSTGNVIGNLARNRFPGGKDASPASYYDFSESIEQTKNWISSGVETIYEAAFLYQDVLCALDILTHVDGELWAIEVKSSADLKDYHLTDASLQYWVMDHCGFKPDRIFLMHINNKFVKNGPIDPAAFFTLRDITGEVIGRQAMVQENLSRLKAVIQSNDVEPSVSIGTHCGVPFGCDYMGHCWKHIPEKSVFGLYSPRNKDWDLYNKGILSLESIPEDYKLNHRQKLQVEGHKHGKSHIDKGAIQEFMTEWKFPLYFFDFETVFPTIPILDGTSPFQQVPFQYSLHIQHDPMAALEHREFLAQPEQFRSGSAQDPRKALIDQLKRDIGPTGNIVAYNASFEMDVISKLANAYPEDRDFLLGLLDRFVDLWIPFRKGWYYKPEMWNSASIKYVLPAIAPEFSYADLEIGNGGDASSTFLSMILDQFEGNREDTRRHLLAYCERDTEGMVVIWKHLSNL